MRRLVVLALAAAAFGPACSEATVTSPSAIGNNLPLAVEVFTGTLPVNGSRFYSFTVPKTGPVSMVLLSLSENGAASAAAVQLGLGVPRGIDCLAGEAATLGTGVVAQVSITAEPAVYCARIGDPGNLTAPAAFSINITRPR
jgi:hypothetical protein